jgi:hypothetical protein
LAQGRLTKAGRKEALKGRLVPHEAFERDRVFFAQEDAFLEHIPSGCNQPDGMCPVRSASLVL